MPRTLQQTEESTENACTETSSGLRHEHCQSGVVGYGLGITGGIFDRYGAAGIVNVNEDHRLIDELGFDVWWNLVQNGPVGLIEGTTAKGQNVYRFTLTQGRVPLVCLYTEDEYKELIIEAHYQCRYHFYRGQGKDKRRWYWCRYCHMDFSDKNALSYHRHKDQCDAWKRLTNGQGGVLKMYPTFKPSDSKAVVAVLAQCGLRFPEDKEHRPWAPRVEGTVTLVEEQPNPTATNTPKATPMKAKSSGSTRHVGVPVSPLSSSGHRDMSAWQTADETDSSTSEGERASKGYQTRSQGPKRLMSVREHRAKKKQRVDTPSETTLAGGASRAAMDSGVHCGPDVPDTTTLGGGDDDGDEATNFQVIPRNMQFGVAEDSQEEQIQSSHAHCTTGQARDEAFQDAQRAAALLTVSDLEILECPPQTRNAPGLYVLLSEGPVPVIDKALLTQPEQCMAVLTKLEEDGELVSRIPAALGPWILWRIANMVNIY